jgi:hypothetical protein
MLNYYIAYHIVYINYRGEYSRIKRRNKHHWLDVPLFLKLKFELLNVHRGLESNPLNVAKKTDDLISSKD